MKYLSAAVAIAVACQSLPAAAQQSDKLIDISRPENVVQAMKAAGYKADLQTSKDGDPFIASEANDSAFTIQFYGCKPDAGCTSLQFFAWYKREPYFSVAMTNKWNAEKRFLKVAIDKDGDLSTFMDISSVGKATQANFADMIDWWETMSGELFSFMDAEEAAAKKPAG
jgi:hypothetical protein